jgi:two-component system sensor histidine kinase and response regulator WspE
MSEARSELTVDPAMFELFRSDISIQKPVLEESLRALRNGQACSEFFAKGCRSIHAVIGAALLVELGPVVEMAGCMEQVLSAAQTGRIALDGSKIDTLLACVAMLEQICLLPDEQLGGNVLETREDLRKLIETVKGFTAPTPVCCPAGGDTPCPGKNGEVSQKEPPAIMADKGMLEIFKIEVSNNAQLLNDGLLALENGEASAATLESLMRGAHSMKGAAHIVGLNQIGRLAHAMEDCFVAAQKKETVLGRKAIDVLLKATDLMVRMSGAAADRQEDGSFDDDNARIESFIASVSAIRSSREPGPDQRMWDDPEADDDRRGRLDCAGKNQGQEALEPKSEEWLDKTGDLNLRTATASCTPNGIGDGRDRMVRVAAAKIERLIGLAGEVVVNSRWLPSFSQTFTSLKRTHSELSHKLEDLQEMLSNGSSLENNRKLIREARYVLKECNHFLAEKRNSLDIFISSSATLCDRLYHEAVRTRMRPFHEGVHGLPRMVRDLARKLGKLARLEIIGESTEVDQDILEKLDAPLTHLLRNCVDHGIELPNERIAAGKVEVGLITLQAEHRSGMLMLKVSDDGRGLDIEKLKEQIFKKGFASAEIIEKMSEAELLEFLFLPGFSTAEAVSDISGRGVGLDIVHNMAHEVGGVVRALARPGTGLAFHLELPITLSVIRTLLVEISGEPYAFPLTRIDRCLTIARDQVMKAEEHQYFRFYDRNISLVDIRQVLEMDNPPAAQNDFSVVVVSDRTDSYGLVVDRFVGECDLVIRPLDPRLGKVPNIGAAALLMDNSPVLIFDIEDLIHSIGNILTGNRLHAVAGVSQAAGQKVCKRILVVDDSITVRELERRMLETKGYQVDLAVDGMDGWNAVRANRYDLVVSDVTMPRMDGIEFIQHIRRSPELQSLPVIIISYKDREGDKQAGFEAGANYYLTKSSFQDDSFLQAVVDLIGEA